MTEYTQQLEKHCEQLQSNLTDAHVKLEELDRIKKLMEPMWIRGPTFVEQRSDLSETDTYITPYYFQSHSFTYAELHHISQGSAITIEIKKWNFNLLRSGDSIHSLEHAKEYCQKYFDLAFNNY